MLTNSPFSKQPHDDLLAHSEDIKLPRPLDFVGKIVLVRHGKSAGNVLSHRPRRDFYLPLEMTDETLPLTDRGKRQAIKTGEWLAQTYPDGFDAIIASPFLRAQKTAEFSCIAAGWNSQSIICEPLVSERDWGVFLDVHRGQQKLFINALRRDQRGGRIPGGESLDEARGRAHEFLRRIHAGYPGKRVIVFTHGEFMQECIAAALEQVNQSADFSPLIKPKNCQVFELSLQTISQQRSASPKLILEKRVCLRTAFPAEEGSSGWQELC